MKELKKFALIMFLFVTLFNFSSFAAHALVWGYFTDINDNFINGIVDATSVGYQDSSAASGGYYMIYLPAGSYTLKATATGHEDETVQITVEDDKTYHIDFALTPEL